MHRNIHGHPRGATLAAFLAAVLLAGCGGGSDGGTGPGSGRGLNGSMQATLNGHPWKANFTVQAVVHQNAFGQVSLFQVSGSDTTGSVTAPRVLLVTLARDTAFTSGSYPLDLASQGGHTAYVGMGSLVQSIQNWNTQTSFGGILGGGSIAIATITSARVTGSFAFIAQPTSGNTGTARAAAVVTNGTFDIPVTTVP